MNNRGKVQQKRKATQLSLFDQGDQAFSPPPTIYQVCEVNTESEEEFELRRASEMAEKLGWPALVIDPHRTWPGLSIPEGEEAWCEFLDEATRGVGLVMLALHKQLNPLFLGSIDKDGLHIYPTEIFSRIEGRYQLEMIQLAEHLGWPRLTYWDVNRTMVFGPGESEWRRYFEYGSLSFFGTAVDALKRRLHGEPDRVKQTSYQSMYVEDDEEE